MLYENDKLTEKELAIKLYKDVEKIKVAKKKLSDKGYLIDSRVSITGEKILKEHEIENAIILAAGMSTRFVPLSFEKPKGLLKVKGQVLIERQILQLREKGIDEIIIVDTGSKDKTKEIAKSFNAQIYDFKWISDFAAARNFSFSKATSDYILWLDGDDFIDDENISKIENLLKSLDTKYDYVSGQYILSRNEEGGVNSVLRRNRIVKRTRNFKWIGKVHEYLEVYGQGFNGDFAIEHGKVKVHTDRNFRIFKKMENEGVEFSPRDMYYYANELMDNGLSIIH